MPPANRPPHDRQKAKARTKPKTFLIRKNKNSLTDEHRQLHPGQGQPQPGHARRRILGHPMRQAHSRTRDVSPRQLPTDHDHAVSTREYQTDQSSPLRLGCCWPCPGKNKSYPTTVQELTGSLHIRVGRARGSSSNSRRSGPKSTGKQLNPGPTSFSPRSSWQPSSPPVLWLS